MAWDYEPGSMYLHFVGGLLAIVAFVAMVARSFSHGASYIVGFIIFGLALILLYTMSSVYHLIPVHASRAKKWMQRLDHSAIYILIAGTYTPLCLTVLWGTLGWTLLAVIWAVAITGISLKLSGVRLPAWLPATIYAVMGWLGLVAIPTLLKTTGLASIEWLVAGGIFYTAGIIFYAWAEFLPKRKWFGMHEVFHIFVMLGSASHVYMLWRYVLV